MDKKSPRPDPSSPAQAHAQGAAAATAEEGGGSAVPQEVASTGSDASGVRRPMRLTPGSGRYAALLAHSRPKPRTGEVPAPIAGSPPGAIGDAVAGAAATGPLGARVSDPLETTTGGAGSAVPAAGLPDVGADSERTHPVPVGAEPTPATVPFDESAPTLVAGVSGGPAKKPVVIPRPTRLTPGGLGGPGLAPLLSAAAVAPKTEAESTQATPRAVAPGGTGVAAPPESVPQSKNSAFVSTIVGVPRVEVSGPAIPAANSWMRPAAGTESRPEAARDGGITFSPVAAGAAAAARDDGKLTPRNAAPAYADSGPVGFSGSSSFSDGGAYEGTLTAVEGPRITERLGVSEPAAGKRRAMAAALATGISVVALGVAGPPLWRRWHQTDGRVSDAQQGTTKPVGSSAVGGSALGNSASAPPKVTTTTAPADGTPAVIPPPPASSVTAPPPPPLAATPPPPLAATPPPPLAATPPPSEATSAPRGVRGSDVADPGKEEESVAASASSPPKAKSRSRAARAEARLARAAARAKAKQKRLEARAARKKGAIAAPASETGPTGSAAAKPPTDGDPDGTLPLTGR